MADAKPTPRNPLQSADIPVQADGDDSFQLGIDSYTVPYKLLAGEYHMAMNVVNRSGVIMTRPGSRSMLDAPVGNAQGCTFFSPTGELPYLVFAVSGKIYVSPEPFTEYYQLQGLQFNPYSKFVTWATCVQSTSYDDTGSLYSLATPKNILMIQDGATRAGYWDGTVSAHINPTKTPANAVSVDIIGATNATPIVLTLASGIVLGTGEQVTVSGVAGNTAANGTWTVTVIDSTHLSLTGSSGNGAFSQSTYGVIQASNTTPILVELQNGIPGIVTGSTVNISGVEGNTAANGEWPITVVDSNHFYLFGSSGNGTYTSGGQAVPVPILTTAPTATGAIATIPGYDGTPIGLWMVWSNNRLWVSRNNQVFASDIGNPLKFTEQQYISEIASFLLPDGCTGAIETPDLSGVVFFTKNVGVFLQSSNQNRSTWNSTQNFQYNIFPNVGCVAGKSAIQQHGLLWWFSPKGLVSQNQALNINVTSRLDVADNEMIESKANLSWDLSCVCGSYIENYLFHAVPWGSNLNTRIHVLDQAPFDGKMDFWRLNSWNSYWEGWRPVEFARGIIGSRERVFCLSQDYDGVNRVWELFRDERYDNGVPITSYVVTKTHIFGNRDYKRFRFLEVEMTGVQGQVAVMTAVAGLKGTYQPVMTKDINAIVGQMYSDKQLSQSLISILGSQPQTRVVRSLDSSDPSCCNAACFEAPDFRGLIDKGLSALIVWSGVAGINAYRIFAQNYPIPYQGTCEDDETGQLNLKNQDGCSSESLVGTCQPFPQYFSTCTYTELDDSGNPVSNTATASSVISQIDADRKALATAKWYVEDQISDSENSTP